MATRCVICVVAVVFSKVLVILFSSNDQNIVQQTCLSSRMTLVSSSISNSSSLSGAWDRETQKKLKGSKRKSHLSINNTRPSPWGPISSHVLSFKSLFSSQESHPLSCKTPAFFSPPLNTYHKIWKRIGYFHWCLSVSSQIPPIITFMITFNVELLFGEESILLMVTAQRSRWRALKTSKAMVWSFGKKVLWFYKHL